jgi:hypothetical protein
VSLRLSPRFLPALGKEFVDQRSIRRDVFSDQCLGLR